MWPIALSRMLIGVLWLFSLRWKLPPDFAPAAGKGLMDWLQLEVQHPAFAFYGDFVANVVIPNFTLFAWLIFLGELVVGLSLLTGTLTRSGRGPGTADGDQPGDRSAGGAGRVALVVHHVGHVAGRLPGDGCGPAVGGGRVAEAALAGVARRAVAYLRTSRRPRPR